MTAQAQQAPGEVTELLLKWRGGDESALDQIFPLIYDELRRMARQFLRHERAGHTMQTTMLVHEAYLRLVKGSEASCNDRAHLLAIIANVMRRVLTDEARKRHRRKRGGQQTRVSLDQAVEVAGEREIDLLALDEALEWLHRLAPRKCRVVEMRFFGGLTIEETAIALSISSDTVKSDWGTAKLWLMRRLSGEEASNGSRAVRED